MLNEGTILNERYQLAERIGSGGFSVVWRAFDIKKQQAQVAVKIFRPEQGLDPKDIKRFEAEYEMTKGLNDSRLLKATDYFVHEESPCLVFKYMEGGSLYDQLRENGTIDEQEIGKLMYQLSGALRYLHTRQPQPVLHLDIKPDNILMNYAGDYVLSDFGISMDLRDTLLRGSQLKGETIQYRAPERILNQGIGTPSDIFAFGVTLYECCTGLLKADLYAPGMAIASGGALPEIDKSKYSRRLEELIHACMQLDPANRPTAGQLEDYAKHFIEHGFWPELGRQQPPVQPVSDYFTGSGGESRATRPIEDTWFNEQSRDAGVSASPRAWGQSPAPQSETPRRNKNAMWLWIGLGALLAGGGGGYALMRNGKNSNTALSNNLHNSDNQSVVVDKPQPVEEQPAPTPTSSQPSTAVAPQEYNTPENKTDKPKPEPKQVAKDPEPTKPEPAKDKWEVNRPSVRQAPQSLRIKHVELNRSNAIITFELYKSASTEEFRYSLYGPGSKNAFFIKYNGSEYKLRRADGISFGEGQTLSGNTKSFRLYFDPIPVDAASMDIFEGKSQLDETQNYWNFKGVRLRN